MKKLRLLPFTTLAALLLFSLLGAPAVSAAIAQRGTATTGTGTTSVTINKPAGVVAGDVMIASFVESASAGSVTATGWTATPSASGALKASSTFMTVLSRVADGTEGSSFAFTLTGSTESLGEIVAFSGVDTSSGTFDVSPVAILADTNPGHTVAGATTITTATANAMVIMLATTDSTTTYSAWATATSPGTLTELYDTQSTTLSVGGASALMATAGSTGAGSVTISNGARNCGVLLALRPKIATSTSVVSTTGSPTTYGATVQFTATVTTTSGTLSGTVDFFDGATLLGSGTIVSGSSPRTASYTTTGTQLSAGSRSITAVFNGDTAHSASTSSAITQTINAKALTVTGVTASNKVYDGTTTATVGGTPALGTAEAPGTGTTGDGLPYTGDGPFIFGGSPVGAFADKNVGTGKTVTVTGRTITGTGSGNYTISNQTPTANITAKALTVTGVTASNKIYDGTTTATLGGTPALGTAEAPGAGTTSDGLPYTGDGAFTFGGSPVGTFADKNVGTGKTVTVTGRTITGTGSGNYTISNQTPTANITTRAITVTAATASKVYDGLTTSATSPTFPALQSGDTTTTFTQSYDTRNVGTSKTLTPAGVVNDGNSGNNYAYTYTTANTGTITARALTVTGAANSKTYDGGTTSATVPTITSGALQGSDTAGFTQSYGDKNVGTSKTLTPAGVVNDGNSGNNYTVTLTPANVGTITAQALTVTAAFNSKTYDGGLTAAAVPTVTVGTVQSGDTANFTEAYSTKTVGAANKTVVPSGTVTDGNSGNNYTYTFVNNTVSTITTRPITVTAVTNTKTADGGVTAAGLPTITSGTLASGDTATWSETYNTAAAGTGKTLTPTGNILDGSLANMNANYNITFVDDTTGVITAATAASIKVETAADGSGTVVPAQSVNSGSSITVYSISRDAFGNFVANVATDVSGWSLISNTGGVVSTDLVAAGDLKSAVFTGHSSGSAVVHAVKAGLTSTDSGTLTVPNNAAKKILGGTLWKDVNRNAVLDGGETDRFTGTRVELWTVGSNGYVDHLKSNTAGDDIFVTYQLTDASGNYSFDNVALGSVYYIRIPTPPPSFPTSSWGSPAADDTVDNDDNGIQLSSGLPVTCLPITVSNNTTDNTKDFGFFAGGVSTAVTMQSFGGYWDQGRVVIEWTTATELGTLGFNIHRKGAERAWIQVNEALTLAANSSLGASYSIEDKGVSEPSLQTYIVEELEESGRLIQYGPFTVVVRPAAKFVQGGLVSGSLELLFKGDADSEYDIQTRSDVGNGAWQTTGTVTSDADGLIQVSDAGVSASVHRFYRALKK